MITIKTNFTFSFGHCVVCSSSIYGFKLFFKPIVSFSNFNMCDKREYSIHCTLQHDNYGVGPPRYSSNIVEHGGSDVVYPFMNTEQFSYGENQTPMQLE
jgi:hypothetical protein